MWTTSPLERVTDAYERMISQGTFSGCSDYRGLAVHGGALQSLGYRTSQGVSLGIIRKIRAMLSPIEAISLPTFKIGG